MENSFGTVIAIKGQIVEIDYNNDPPNMHDLYVMDGTDEILLEVYASASERSVYCIGLTALQKLYKGARLINTKKSLINTL